MTEIIAGVYQQNKEFKKNIFRVYFYWQVQLKKGVNAINIHAINPNLVLEKMVICEEGAKIPESYLGLKPTYRS